MNINGNPAVFIRTIERQMKYLDLILKELWNRVLKALICGKIEYFNIILFDNIYSINTISLL